MFSTRIRKSGSGSPPVQHKEGAFFQPKLTINAPGDKYEQEADAMAERVVQLPEGKGPASVAEAPGSVQRQEKEPEETPVQRKCADCEQKEKERLQRQANKEEEQLQRQPEQEEEHAPPVQTKPLMRKNAGGGYSATPALSTQLSASKGQGTALPAPTRAHMETAFGADFGQVRIHTDSRAADMNAGVNARAFTHGSDIYFNKGQYAPEGGEGRKLLAHELTHVVQQGRGEINRKEIIRKPEIVSEEKTESIAFSEINLGAFISNLYFKDDIGIEKKQWESELKNETKKNCNAIAEFENIKLEWDLGNPNLGSYIGINLNKNDWSFDMIVNLIYPPQKDKKPCSECFQGKLNYSFNVAIERRNKNGRIEKGRTAKPIVGNVISEKCKGKIQNLISKSIKVYMALGDSDISVIISGDISIAGNVYS